MTKLAVTENTAKLLKGRSDDYRLALIYDVMFSDDFSGSHPERKFTVQNNDGKEETYQLRKADVYDCLSYEKVTSSGDMKTVIEQNIDALQRMKKNGTVPGMLAVGDVWVFLFTTDNTGANMSLNTYFNPNAADCSEIFKSERMIVMVGFCVTYPTNVGKDQVVPEGYPDELLEFSFLSPLDQANLSEYAKIAYEEECKALQDMFLIKFGDK